MASADDKIVYEGDVYVRPIGRGIMLEDEHCRPCLHQWIEAWLAERHPGHALGGYPERLRIVVEVLAPSDRC
jgi:hypothetical protein